MKTSPIINAQQIENEQKQRQARQASLNVKADDYWNNLTQVLKRDINKLNSLNQDKIGEIRMEVEGLSLIRIIKSDFPAYRIDLRLLTTLSRIEIESQLNNGFGSIHRYPVQFLTLNIINDQLHVCRKLFELYTVDRLSERLLIPIVESTEPILRKSD